MRRALPLALVLLLIAPGFARGAGDDALPAHAVQAADHAAQQYDDAQVALLAKLVRYEAVNKEGVANAENPAFRAFARHVEQSARDLGLDFTDYGAVLRIGDSFPGAEGSTRARDCGGVSAGVLDAGRDCGDSGAQGSRDEAHQGRTVSRAVAGLLHRPSPEPWRGNPSGVSSEAS